MQRSYDIDWLRTLIVITIIPFHAFIIFDQNPEAIMYVKNKMNILALCIYKKKAALSMEYTAPSLYKLKLLPI